jgi:hypothetical protein
MLASTVVRSIDPEALGVSFGILIIRRIHNANKLMVGYKAKTLLVALVQCPSSVP